MSEAAASLIVSGFSFFWKWNVDKKGMIMQRFARVLSVLLVLVMTPLFFRAAPAAAANPSLSIAVVDAQGSAVSAVSTNVEGWPTPNVLTVKVSVTCPSDGLGCNPDLIVDIGSSTGKARFYIYTATTPSTICDDTPSSKPLTYTTFHTLCNLSLLAGQSIEFTWSLWIQPSEADSLTVAATYSTISANYSAIPIAKAQIHPIVFLHGILGSMDPKDRLLADENSMHSHLDPFLGSYWPLIDNLQKMGYAWGKSLWVLNYDWRQPNIDSAIWLKDALTLIHGITTPTYVTNSRADLIVHSMGGLVTRAYLEGFAGAYNNDVRKVIFIASPHKGFPFDYQTWEGMTWSAYLNDAPLTAGSSLLATFMNANLWPILVEKRFQPQEADLAACSFWNQYTDWAIGLHPWEVAVAGNQAGAPGTYLCSKDIVAAWAHGLNPASPTYATDQPDQSRASWSLHEMLPTVEESIPTSFPNSIAHSVVSPNSSSDPNPPYIDPAYLIRKAAPNDTWPYGPPPLPGYEFNSFLHNLNLNIDAMVSNLGAQNIYVIAGDSRPTDGQYNVYPPPAAAAPFEASPRWRHGEVKSDSIVQDNNGDGLILINSTTLQENGLLTLQDARQEVKIPGADHKGIMYNDVTMKQLVPRFLGAIADTDSAALPFSTTYLNPFATTNIGNLFSIRSACPIDLLVTDPQGRRLGYDPTTGQEYREIPHAIYTGSGDEPQILLIANAVAGTYQIKSTGYAAGSFLIQADRVENTTIVPISGFDGQTINGQINNYTVNYNPGAPTATNTPTATSTATATPTRTPTTTSTSTPTVTPMQTAMFQPAVYYPVGNSPYDVAAGDLNHDGKPDLVVGNRNSFNFGTLLGNGNGTFQAMATNASLTYPTSLALVDLNGDNNLDVVTANDPTPNVGVSVLLGTSNGTFQAAVNYPVPGVSQSLAVGDMDGDGKLDIVVSKVNYVGQNNGGNSVGVLIGSGTGTFQAAMNYAVGTSPRFVAIGDLTGDGKRDIITANTVTNDVSVLVNTGTGTFQNAVNYPVGSVPTNIKMADLNGDGKQDIIASGSASLINLTVLLGNGDGTFQTPKYTNGSVSYNWISLGDLNGDGKLDVAATIIAGTAVDVLLGIGDGSFSAPTPYPVGSWTHRDTIADLNGDGKLDIVVTDLSANRLGVLLNQFSPPATLTPTRTPTRTATPTNTPTGPTNTPTRTATPTSTPTGPTNTPTRTATPTSTPTGPTNTPTAMPTATPGSSTRIKDSTFESGSLTDATTGVDAVVTPVSLETAAPIKGSYSARIPNSSTGYLKEDFTATDELFTSFYLKLNAAPASSARIALISNSGTSVGNVNVTSSRTLQLRNGSTTIGSASAALTVGTVYRVGIHQKKGTGGNAVLEVYLATGDAGFGSPFASSVVESFTTQATRLSLGATNSNAIDATFDDIRLDTASMPAPSGGAGPTATPTATPTNTPTATPTPISGPTSTPTRTPTATSTPTNTPIGGPTTTPTATPTATPGSSTRIKDSTFENGSLTDATTGVDAVVTPVSLETAAPIKGSYSARIPNSSTGYLREDFTATDELFTSFYLKLNAAPASSARIALISNSGTSVGNINITSSRTLQLRNGSTTIGSASAVLTVGTVYRVGIHQKKGTGGNAVLEVYLATGDAGFGSPFASSAVESFTTQATRLSLGATNSNAIDATFDDIRLDSATMP